MKQLIYIYSCYIESYCKQLLRIIIRIIGPCFNNYMGLFEYRVSPIRMDHHRFPNIKIAIFRHTPKTANSDIFGGKKHILQYMRTLPPVRYINPDTVIFKFPYQHYLVSPSV
jgi:hypothetical protein